MAEIIPKSSNTCNNDLETQKLNPNELGSNHDHHDHDDHDDENFAYALQIAELLPFPMVMQAAIELDLLGILSRAAGQLTAAEVAAALPAARNPDAPAMLDRMLFLLATYSVVSCTTVTGGDGVAVRKYGVAPVGKYFVGDENGESLMGVTMCFVQDEAFLASWSKLKEAVLEGGVPFDKVHGMNAFEYQRTNPRFNKIFNETMLHQSTNVNKMVLSKYKGFHNIHKLVDVGGGLGHCLRAITSTYPSIQGINFDLPHVIQHAPPIPGVEHVGGNMFEVIPQGDAIFLKCILHDWNDEHCLQILKNCHTALSRKGKVIVVEINKPEEPDPTAATKAISQVDIFLMAQLPGGKERTRKEFETLAKATGFTRLNLVCMVSKLWVMEFLK